MDDDQALLQVVRKIGPGNWAAIVDRLHDMHKCVDIAREKARKLGTRYVSLTLQKN